MKPSEAMEKRLQARLQGVAHLKPTTSSVVSGTTALGLKYRGGVILAADTKTSMGSINYSLDSKKLRLVSSFSAIAHAGIVGLLQLIEDVFENEVNMFERESGGRSLPLHNQAIVLQKILRHVFLSNIPNEFAFVFGGFDIVSGESALYEFDGAAAMFERDYTVTGSGMPFAISHLDLNFRKKLSRKKAIELATDAIRASAHRDQHTGGSILAISIDKNGVREADER